MITWLPPDDSIGSADEMGGDTKTLSDENLRWEKPKKTKVKKNKNKSVKCVLLQN